MSKEKSGNFKYVKFFFVIVAVIVFLAIGLRLVNSYKSRSFTHNSFNILVLSDKYAGVIGVDENENRISSVFVTENANQINRENIMYQSVNFGVPIHATISYPNNIEPKAPTKSFFSASNIRDLMSDRELRIRNISLFDWAKLYFIGRKIDSDENVLIRQYATINDLNGLLPEEEESLFRNSELSVRKTSLQVINGTSINGLATKVGDMYSRAGYNVVSVLTNPDMQESGIYYSNEDYEEDAKFIGKTFKFLPTVSDKFKVADITLVIGEESELDFETQ